MNRVRIATLVITGIVIASLLGGCFGLFGEPLYTVSGKVADSQGNGISGVSIVYTGGASGTTTTGADGTFTIASLKGSVTLTPQKTGWSFSPTNKSVTGAQQNVNFTGTQLTYTITTSVTGQGSVSADPDQTDYTYGQSVTLTATPETGWTFSHWTGALEGTQNPATVTVDGNKSVTAVFTQNQYSLTIDIDGEGSVDKDPDQATYTYGSVVELTANPDTGYSFAGWQGDLSGTETTETITIDGDKVITAVFAPIQYSLTVSVEGQGTVDTDPDQETYAFGSTVELEAGPADGWEFSYWTGDVTGSQNPATVTVDGDMTITAVFVEGGYSLTVSVTGEGTVARDPDQQIYADGSTVELTATPEVGWSFAGWEGDLTGTEATRTITMDSNKTVTAVFTQDQYSLTVNVTGQGTVDKDPVQATYVYGDTVQLTATPEDGWSFSGWDGDLTGTDPVTTITMDGDKSVTATFTQDQYTLTINFDGEGTVDVDPDQETYLYGDTVELTATPEDGWTFTGWEGDVTGTDPVITITMDGNKTVTAVFTADLAPVAWYRFDSAETATVDSSANANNGTLENGASFTSSGRFGGGLSLDGVDDYMKVPHSTSLDITGNQITVSVWVKFNTSASRSEIVLAKVAADGTHSDPYFLYSIHRLSNGTLRFFVASTTAYHAVSATPSLEAGQWYHIVGVYDGTALKLYVNNDLVGTAPLQGVTLRSATSSLRLGTNGKETEVLDGVIDEVLIFDKALTEDQIEALYLGE